MIADLGSGIDLSGVEGWDLENLLDLDLSVLLDLLALFWRRLQTACMTWPDPEGWLLTLGLLLIYGTVALILGSNYRFLSRGVTPRRWLQITLSAWFAPALMEEIGFRVLLLPHANEGYPVHLWWIWGGLGLLLYILYHPLNALTFYPAGYPTFLRPIFLVLTAGLGLICTLTYEWLGSLWPPLMLHWIVVSIWLCRLGGWERINLSGSGTRKDPVE